MKVLGMVFAMTGAAIMIFMVSGASLALASAMLIFAGGVMRGMAIND